MPEAKIEFKVGLVSFLGEGDKDWVAQQLDKIIEHLPKLSKVAPKSPKSDDETESDVADGEIASKALGIYLKEKGVGTNQTKKFLCTAIWLHAKGDKRLATSQVTKALSDNQQGKFSNAAQSLNNNVSQGYCAKEGKEFYVTPEGYENA